MGYKNVRKYRNQKVTMGDHSFDSKKELNRYLELSMLQKAGEISGLRCQVKYVLIPAQRDPWTGKVVERECAYVADFVYQKGTETVVEDTKGFRTKDYILKRKMMLWFHGIRIREV